MTSDLAVPVCPNKPLSSITSSKLSAVNGVAQGSPHTNATSTFRFDRAPLIAKVDQAFRPIQARNVIEAAAGERNRAFTVAASQIKKAWTARAFAVANNPAVSGR